MINPKTQRFMAERMGAQTRSLPADHMPLLTAPQSVVETILVAARGSSLFIRSGKGEPNMRTNKSTRVKK